MKVAIVNPIQRRFSGGYYKYLGELVPRLAVEPRVTRLSVWVPEGAEAPDPGVVLKRWRGGMTAAGLRELKRHIASERPDVVLIPTARHIAFGTVPVVVMVRNMEPMTMPFDGNDLLEGVRNVARGIAARRACRRSTRVIAVSNYVRDFLTGPWGIPAGRIGVVYHGVRPDDVVAERPSFAEALGGRPFLFTAGSLRAARGLEDLIEGMPAVLARTPELRVVISGRWDPGATRYRKRITALVDRAGVASSLLWPGHQPQAQMAWCFEHCAAFIMTSRSEACPNTALEALSRGAAIVSTTQAPMPEFLGDAAEYYPPHDGAALAKAVLTLQDETAAARAERRARARAISSAYTWDATVAGTVRELQAAIADRRTANREAVS